MRALVLIAVLVASAAYAQLRSIPPDAKLAQMSHVSENIVEVKGERFQLSPGAQIRDAMNRIIVPATLPPDSLVKYQLDSAGFVHRVWILTPHEQEQAR